MTRYLLDTNIISNATRPRPSPALAAWMSRQADEDLFIASLALAEITRGVLDLPVGRKRRELEQWLAGPDGPHALFAGRILAFDERAAMVWARLMSEGKAGGRPRNPLDMIVAASAEANGCRVVTDNTRDFEGIEFLNPMRE